MIKDILNANEKINIGDRELAALREYFPECFKTDGSFDVDRLAKKLKSKVNITREGYELNFLGKNYARLLSAVDTTSIVQPDTEHNALPENAASENIYISGDNLDALKLLLKSYAGMVKCIYIDPPYNTGSDGFVYNDKFKFSATELETKLSIDPAQAQKILDMTTKQAASHSAWLTFMYPRLLLARDMLSDDGVIFISIDDNEQANLKLLCDEVFGEENFVANVSWHKNYALSNDAKKFANVLDSVLVFSKSILFDRNLLPRSNKQDSLYKYDSNDGKGLWRSDNLSVKTYSAEYDYEIVNPNTNVSYNPPKGRCWCTNKDTLTRWVEEKRVFFGQNDKGAPQLKRYLSEVQQGVVPSTYWSYDEFGHNDEARKELKELFENPPFDTPKPTRLIKGILNIGSNDNDLILDFFSGSATTAHAVLQLNAEDGGNRKYIMVQLPEQCKPDSEAARNGYETIDQIGMERIRRAAQKIRAEHPDAAIDYGFRHFTLCEPPENTLDKMEIFDPHGIVADTTILDDFGRDAALRTWAVRDGYGLTAAIEEINLAGYIAYRCGRHLYLTDENITYEAIEALIAKFENVGAFNPETIVLFGYSFGNWELLETLRTNIRQLSSGEKNLSVNIISRY